MHHPGIVDEFSLMQARYEYSGSAIVYAGFAPPGASESDALWVVKKYSYDGSDNLVKITFAGGSKAFDKTWSDRAGYSYA